MCYSAYLIYILNTYLLVFLSPLLFNMQIRNEKAKRYLSNMRKKQPIPFHQKFPCVDSLALRLLERLLAFDPKDRPTAEEVGFS